MTVSAMRLILTILILLILSACVGLSREHYDAVNALDSNYQALHERDRQLSHALEAVKQRHQSEQEH